MTGERVRRLPIEADPKASPVERIGETRRDLPDADIAIRDRSVHHSAVIAVTPGIGGAAPTLRSAWRSILEGVHGGHTPPR